ncbi:MAG: xanthine dehydrogenase family protein subunit M, partial [Candidatus Moranbacteria bacterium]|nr:xanthine dehydrogenase family protein subunit M [Candidatus Moranbacteria bacterium]
STQIRNRGTLAGNVVNASPAGDGILALYLLDAVLEIVKKDNSHKNIRIIDFIKGPGRTSLTVGEFVRSIKIPYMGRNYRSVFRKIGQRKAMAISIASMGLLIEKKGKMISDVKIAFGSVAPTVLRITEMEQEAFGRELNTETAEMFSEIVYRSVTPIDDVRASADYRRKVCRNLVKELISFN